jgi:hypothetical protein
MGKVYLVKQSTFEDDGGLGGGSFGEYTLVKAFYKKTDATKYLKAFKKKLVKYMDENLLYKVPRWDSLSDEQKLWKYEFKIEPLEVS